LFGASAGSGMAVLIFFCGICILLVSIIGYYIPVIRNADEILPDHDAMTSQEAVMA